jgi:hypothetical protein
MASAPLHIPSPPAASRWRRVTATVGTALVLVAASAVWTTPASADDPPGGPASSVVAPEAVTIAGTVAVGQTVHVEPGTWAPEGAVLTYQWSAASDPVEGAVADELVIGPELLGLPLSVTVTGTAPDLDPASLTSTPVTVAAGEFLSAPVPLVSGAAQVGAELVADPGTWAPAAGLTYQWSADGTEIDGATAARYTPQVADHGKQLAVTVTATATGYTTTAQPSLPTAPVGDGSFVASPIPTVSGTVRVGSPLTVSPGTWSPGPDLSVQWLAGGVAITGATGEEYTPLAADLGKQLTVRVTGTTAGYATTSRTSAPTVAVAPGVFAASPTPTLAGAVRVGGAVTATPGAWSPTATSSYQWRRNGVPIAGATGAVYRPAVADRGYQLSVSVTGRLGGYTQVTRTSAATTITPGVFTTAPTPTIAGTARVGYVLTARPGTWGPAGTLSYRWLRNGALIAGATGAGYRLTAADHGRRIAVRVTASRAGWTAAARTSAATAVVVTPFSATFGPTISGTGRVGGTLKASVRAWSPGATFTYQWRRAGAAIPGATGASYRLTALDYQRVITVTVTGRRTAYVPAAYTSRGTARIAGPAASLSKDGTYAVGTQLPAGTYVTGATQFCYWERRSAAGSDLSGVIANDFGDGRRIVRISSTDRYFYTEGCGSWTRLTALGAPAASIGNGVSAVGLHIVPGVYQAPGGPGCYWARLSGFGAELEDIIDNFFGDGQQVVRIEAGDAGFESADCGTWTRTGD